MVWYEKLNYQLNRLPVHMQVPDLWTQITHGNLSVQFQVLIFDLKIPAGWVQVDPQVNLWRALLPTHIAISYLFVVNNVVNKIFLLSINLYGARSF